MAMTKDELLADVMDMLSRRLYDEPNYHIGGMDGGYAAVLISTWMVRQWVEEYDSLRAASEPLLPSGTAASGARDESQNQA